MPQKPSKPPENTPAALGGSGQTGPAGNSGDNPAKGIMWMLITGLLFVCVTGIVRHIGSDMNPLQSSFLRYVFGLVFLLPLFLRGSISLPAPRMLGRHAIRGFLHGIGVMLWFFAMSRIPIADVTALGFTAPIFITIGAALFLGERLRLRRITAVVVSFIGALIILRPGFAIVDPGAWAQLIAAPLFAASMLMAKSMTRGENSAAIVAYLSIFVTLTLLPGAIAVWRTPTFEELGWLIALASIATMGHLTMTQAYKSTDITVTQPVTFLQLVWAVLLGFYMFDEAPDVWTISGGLIIIAGASYIVHREAQLRRSQK